MRNTQGAPLNEHNKKVTEINKITSDYVVTKEVRQTTMEGLQNRESIKSYQLTEHKFKAGILTSERKYAPHVHPNLGNLPHNNFSVRQILKAQCRFRLITCAGHLGQHSLSTISRKKSKTYTFESSQSVFSNNDTKLFKYREDNCKKIIWIEQTPDGTAYVTRVWDRDNTRPIDD